MKPLRLYIENFMCHKVSFIDFTTFNTALIVGKVENNDLYSNGVGKTTIFKAFEYVLFNQADVNLEKVIRDGSDFCCITLDFMIGDDEYRIIRKRTKKSTDFSLYIRTLELSNNEEVYHILIDNIYQPITISKDNKFWTDKSGSRASDTEKDLDKLIKINYKSFRSTIHFIQNDFGGLATSTPEKRKAILKDALNILIYSKLEKIAKDNYNILVKDIDKCKTLLEALGSPTNDIIELQNQFLKLDQSILDKTDLLDVDRLNLLNTNTKINEQTIIHSNLESKFSDLLNKKQILISEKYKKEISIKEYSSKKSNAAKAAKSILDEINTAKELQKSLIETDFSQIDSLNEYFSLKKEEITRLNIVIQNNSIKYEELKIPLPNENICKHCRQELNPIHKKECQDKINLEIEECQIIIKNSKQKIVELNSDIQKIQQNINSLSLSKKQLENINIEISSKNKEIQDKKTIYNEYSELFDKFTNDLKLKIEEQDQIEEELKKSSMDEANIIKTSIDSLNKELQILNKNINIINQNLTNDLNNKAIIQHNIDQKNKDVQKINFIKLDLLKLNEKSNMYPEVIKGFSTIGIPNLIIQTVLDDLQLEANNLLNQLKPGLQLSFFVEKTVEKTGDMSDTLDINYHINGKERYYEQLSGAQKIAITFSLKLGLSFLLQKMIGTEIKFLMLDEIDQSLDKASIDAFADIIKFFQKDFTILVITHNDRLRDKFNSFIVVSQDSNMISSATNETIN